MTYKNSKIYSKKRETTNYTNNTNTLLVQSPASKVMSQKKFVKFVLFVVNDLVKMLVS